MTPTVICVNVRGVRFGRAAIPGAADNNFRKCQPLTNLCFVDDSFRSFYRLNSRVSQSVLFCYNRFFIFDITDSDIQLICITRTTGASVVFSWVF